MTKFSDPNKVLIDLLENDWKGLMNTFVHDQIDDNFIYSADFLVFQRSLVPELEKSLDKGKEGLMFAMTLFSHHDNNDVLLKLDSECSKELAGFLFKLYPSQKYARYIPDSSEAKLFQEKWSEKNRLRSEKIALATKLDITISEAGNLLYDKSIFNSKPEKILYQVANRFFNEYFVIPNTALSTVIHKDVCDSLDFNHSEFFFKSTLDLCIVDYATDRGKWFIELDSSWHDTEEAKLRDQMKNQIFKAAGLKLHRIRRLNNAPLEETFNSFFQFLISESRS